MARITLGPGGPTDWFHGLIEPTGCTVVDDPADAEGLVWLDPSDAAALTAILQANPHIRWVQLPMAGVEKFVDAGVFNPHGGRTWTAAKAIYGEPVAEHALALTLAGLRHLHERAKATSWAGPGSHGTHAGHGTLSSRTLFGANVAILGAGGIAEALLRLLEPFRVQATVVRRQAEPGAGGASATTTTLPARPRVVGRDRLYEALAEADVVVLALALTPDTIGIIGAPELDAMKDDAWLVNVARGAHVDTDALVDALDSKQIGGAALDVTDPEPLPDEHPLWRAPNCLITPHAANTPKLAWTHLSGRIAENARRFAAGEELLGAVDVEAGY